MIYNIDKKGLKEKVIDAIWPLYGTLQAGNKIDDFITDWFDGKKSFDYMKGYQRLKIEDVKKYLERTFEFKRILEDKAKVNVFGVTLAVSVITGLAKVIFDFNIHDTYFILKLATLFFAVLALIYMMVAGILSLAVLGELNTVYEVFPDDFYSADTAAECTELNSKLNSKRNNYINCSYKNIRNSLFVLIVLFVIIVTPFNSFKKNETDILTEVHKVMESQKEITKQLQYNEKTLEYLVGELGIIRSNQKQILEYVYSLTKN